MQLRDGIVHALQSRRLRRFPTHADGFTFAESSHADGEQNGGRVQGRTCADRPPPVLYGRDHDRIEILLALASWCADLAIKRPCESVLATVVPAAHDRDATRRVHRCVARLPARPRPAPLGATNSSPGACNAPTPPSRCISPPACSRSITPPVAVARSRGCTHAASQGTRSTPRPTSGFLTHSKAPLRSWIAASTSPFHNCPSNSFSNARRRSLGPPAELIDS